MGDSRPHVLLLMSPSSYRGGSFTRAAERTGIRATVVVDLPPELSAQWRVSHAADFRDVDAAIDALVAMGRQDPIDAVIAVDDAATVLASRASRVLGLAGNDPQAAVAARHKGLMRRLFRDAGLATPPGIVLPATLSPPVDGMPAWPVVVKPVNLSGSRGVIRADSPDAFAAAWQRSRAIVRSETAEPDRTELLVEAFWPGFEVALEGLMTDGELRVLALFDKPDPLDGPLFEETIYVTPSRLPVAVQAAIRREAEAGARAMGLVHGPIHAELRVDNGTPWIVEIAGRSIGGLCSTVLQFGTDLALEDIILRHAVGLPVDDLVGAPSERAAGAMMIPIPRAGILQRVDGTDVARAVRGVDGVEISARLRYPLVPLPEGAAYLGFIFASGSDPAAVEGSLRIAHAALHFDIRTMLPLATSTQPA